MVIRPRGFITKRKKILQHNDFNYYNLLRNGPQCLQLDVHKAFTHIAYGPWQGMLFIIYLFVFLVTHIPYNQNVTRVII